MNTREREVMDALATALRDARDSVAGELAHERAAFKGHEGSSNIAQLEAELVAIDSALAAYDTLLAEGSASSEGAVAPRYVQWTNVGGVRIDLDSFFKSDAGKAALARFEASAQGEHKQRSSEEGAEAVDWQVRRTGFMPGEEPEWMRISKEDFDNPRRFVTSAWERRALYIHPQSAQEGAVAVGLPLRHRLFCVFAHSSEFNMNVRIPGHIGTMEEIRESVMGKARREGYQGDFVERMAELRWWLVPLYTHPQPAQGEQFHMSQAAVTVADVARLIECKVADVLRAGRDKCSLMLTANQMVSVEDAVLLARWTLHEQRGMRAALESALPRGLPSGSDAQLKVIDEVIRLLESPHVMPSPTGGVNYAPEHYFGLLHDFKRVRTELATAEQPSCGQDARDAARFQWSVEHARWIRHEHEAYVAIPVARDADLSCKATRIAAIDAAIAAQQRQGE